MESWPSQDVPRLPGFSSGLSLYDTASGLVRPTQPSGTARMYVCGITPYDATHMGHAFTYVTFDLINRVWRDMGLDVHYVQNVTDIDDPLLERAVATGQDWRAIADRETALFRADMEALNVLPPRDYIGAVESIPSVAAHVQTLRDGARSTPSTATSTSESTPTRHSAPSRRSTSCASRTTRCTSRSGSWGTTSSTATTSWECS